MSPKRADVKLCSWCGVELPTSHTNNHYCKACRKVYNAKYWARRRDREARRVCVVCGVEQPASWFGDAEAVTCRRCAYLARLRKPGWELRKAKREGTAPKGEDGRRRPRRKAGEVSSVTCQVSRDAKPELEPGPWAVATRTGGRVPVLRYEQHGGVWMCFMTDGVEETALYVEARQAVWAWNTGQVSSVTCQVSRAAEMDRARLEERARSGELSPVTIVSAGVQAECSTLGVCVKES